MTGISNQSTGDGDPKRDSRSSGFRTWLARIGYILSAFGAVVLVAGFALESLVGLQAVAAQVIAFPVATGAFVLGLLLVLLGWILGAPKEGLAVGDVVPAGHPVWRRRTVLALSLGAMLAVVVLGVGTARSLTVVDSPEFCTSCHLAMRAEETAYAVSPHSRVACADCHIGPGVVWFIRAKWTGLQELVAYVRGSWEQPIPVPVASLRPAQDTCERCHWPEKFTSDRLVVRPHFAPDEANTSTASVLVVHTGGGTPGTVGASGIHYNMVTQNVVRYVATDPERQKIPWVEAIGPDGKSTVYQDTSAPLQASPTSDQLRQLDCIDCHNRPTHIFPTPDQALDASLDAGAIDRSLPFIKREALAALAVSYPDAQTALQQIANRLRAFYQQNYPAVVAAKPAPIDQAVTAVQGIYSRSFFPDTKVDWQTYPNNLGHQSSLGCFRCHDGKHVSNAGQVIVSSCDTCHTVPQSMPLEAGSTLKLQASLVGNVGSAAKAIPHTLEGRSDCLTCHATGAQAVPASHQGRANDTCQSCHKPAVGAATAAAAQAIPHAVVGFATCLDCHASAASGARAVPADHAGRTDGVCQQCHQPSQSTAIPSVSNARKIVHVTAGNADCLSCHATGAQAVPADHAGRANNTCQSCHAPSPSATAMPTQAGATIPHVILGREDCLSCHAKGDQAVPATHAGRTNDTCLACHKQDPSAANASQIRHTVARFGDCLGCHAAGAFKVPASHAGRPNALCLECHVQSATARTLAAGASAPHPSNMPPCLNCHRVGGGESGLPTSHVGRTSNVCRLCH